MRRLLSGLGAAAVLAAVTGWAVPALAHGDLERGSPGPGDEVAPGGSVVALVFDVIAGDRDAFVAVLGPDGNPVPVGAATTLDDRLVCASTAPLEPGIHTVEYAVTDDDGHPQEGRYTFEVAGSGQPADPGACAGQDLARPGEPMTLAQLQEAAQDPVDLRLVAGVGALVLVAGALAGRRLWRERNRGV